MGKQGGSRLDLEDSARQSAARMTWWGLIGLLIHLFSFRLQDTDCLGFPSRGRKTNRFGDIFSIMSPNFSWTLDFIMACNTELQHLSKIEAVTFT